MRFLFAMGGGGSIIFRAYSLELYLTIVEFREKMHDDGMGTVSTWEGMLPGAPVIRIHESATSFMLHVMFCAMFHFVPLSVRVKDCIASLVHGTLLILLYFLNLTSTHSPSPTPIYLYYRTEKCLPLGGEEAGHCPNLSRTSGLGAIGSELR
ncbi:uncharacterized protein LY89DRAFT_198761 [Mollisia scopiformis]|uniref:Uncharacterized protein n=1 Tax=Mollisia scopiformis TaxID=149040 RepID=A0A194WYK3_MOLSC|nr:uncharacterized protein LY89DRAFT_198761 [Mollisia scopiformis]KUJ13025.1 hypothetical protein LY89DRAFT_198761 [Mollisia scopiformis]